MTKLEKLELELKEMLKNNSIKNQSKELFNENGFQYKKKAKENVSKLKVSDNSSKLLTEYDKESFDEWMNDLIKRNGTTKY